jgi:dynein heavy chain
LGSKFIEQISLNLDELVNESDAKTPIMCLLSIGTDPSDNILAMAKQRDKGILFEYNVKFNEQNIFIL